MTREKFSNKKIKSWHFMIMVITISLGFYVWDTVNVYIKNWERVQLELKVIIFEQQVEIGELKNRILELELDLD